MRGRVTAHSPPTDRAESALQTRQDVCDPRRVMTVDSACAGLDVVRDDLQRRHCETSCTRPCRRAQAFVLDEIARELQPVHHHRRTASLAFAQSQVELQQVRVAYRPEMREG